MAMMVPVSAVALILASLTPVGVTHGNELSFLFATRRVHGQGF